MVFAHDTVADLESAAFLANSELEPDTLTDFEHLETFFDDFGYSSARPKRSDLEAVRAIRSTLRSLFKASRDGAVLLVNDILGKQQALPQLVRHGDVDWHIHATPDDSPFASRILVETAMAMIEVI